MCMCILGRPQDDLYVCVYWIDLHTTLCMDYWADFKTMYVCGLLGWPQDDLCVWIIGLTSRRPMCMDYWVDLKTTCVYGLLDRPLDNLVYGLLDRPQDDLCVWTIGPTSRQPMCMCVLGRPQTKQGVRTYCVCLEPTSLQGRTVFDLETSIKLSSCSPPKRRRYDRKKQI